MKDNIVIGNIFGNFDGAVVDSCVSMCKQALYLSPIGETIENDIVNNLYLHDTDVYAVTKEEDGYFLNYLSANICDMAMANGFESVDTLFFEPKKNVLHAYFKRDYLKIVLNNIGNIESSKVSMRWIAMCVLVEEDGSINNAMSRVHTIDSWEEL